MSCDEDTESSTVENGIDSYSKSTKYDLTPEILDKLENAPEALDLIKRLQKYIGKQRRRIRKLQAKINRKISNLTEAGSQTEDLAENANNVEEGTPLANVANEEPKSIAEEIKEAAELATQNSGFVYDETTGLYYDSNTGYYYNAEYGLYYDATTGTYMQYCQETNTYQFHSQVPLPSAAVTTSAEERPVVKEKSKKHRKRHNVDEPKEAVVAPKKKRKSPDITTSVPQDKEDESCSSPKLGEGDGKLEENLEEEEAEEEPEEGECSETSESEEEDSTVETEVEEEDEAHSDSSEISKPWPPCMRLIVEQSTNAKIKIGSLHILTFSGGTLGREGDQHCVLLPDVNISKCHLKFAFDKDRNRFFATDLGSRNGTILNGKRMSASKQESEALEVAHGSRIQIGGSVVLLCHVHDGTKTCGLCEPGLVQHHAEIRKEESLYKTSKSVQHQIELKNLRKKFGVNSFEENNAKLASGYTDRAEKRRTTVGSQNPHEKTEVASVQETISSTNKGFKMLAKMGWKEGQSLGKDSQGMLEPVPLVSNPGTAGMGSEEPVPEATPRVDKAKQLIWKKTQERFKKLPATTNAFEDEESD